MEMPPPQPPLADLPAPFPDHVSEIGPVELNILERIENGLNISDHEIDSDGRISNIPDQESVKFTGRKEVMSVSGWASIRSIYEEFAFEFTSRIVVGAAVLLCMLHPFQALWPIAAVLMTANLILLAKHATGLNYNWKGSPLIRSMFWLDINLSASYTVYFAGWLLYLLHWTQPRSLPFFGLPLAVFSLFLLFQTSDNPYLGQKRFVILGVAQLACISLKVGGYIAASWGYVLFIYSGATVYVLVVGFFLTLILICSFTGLIYQNIYRWKVKALVWMSWYYLSSGIAYMSLIRGVTKFFRDEMPMFPRNDIVYNNYTDGDVAPLVSAAVLLMATAFASLSMHLLWEKDIHRFLTKVVYKYEVRKEIALRFLAKSFTFRLVQVSTTYLKKVDDKQDAGEARLEVSLQGGNKSGLDKEPCAFCCEREPEVLIEPCNHGGVCKQCMVNYLNGKATKCPFCKGPVDRIFILEAESGGKGLVAKGQILFKN